MEFTSSALNGSPDSNKTLKNTVLTWTRTAVYTDDDQSPPAIIKPQKRFSHRMSVQNSQNWEENLFSVQENTSFSLSVSFLKSECRIAMCQLGTKALVGMAQNNVITGLLTGFSEKLNSANPNLVPGLRAEILSQVISVNAFVLKKPYWLTPQRQPDPVLSTTLWGFLQSLWQKCWESFQLSETFSVNLTTFQNQLQCLLARSARGEHVGLVSAPISSLLTNWDTGSATRNLGCSPQTALVGLTPNCLWHHPESSGHWLLTELLKNQQWLLSNATMWVQKSSSNGEKPLPRLPLWPRHTLFLENSQSTALWACAQPTLWIKLWAETLRLADEAPSLSLAVVWRLSSSMLHLAWPLFSPHWFI